MSTVLRAKLRVSSVTRSIDGDGNVSSEKVDLVAVYSNDPDSENRQWSKWTPAAHFSLQINNPKAFGTLANGHEFYVDFIPAGQQAAA